MQARVYLSRQVPFFSFVYTLEDRKERGGPRGLLLAAHSSNQLREKPTRPLNRSDKSFHQCFSPRKAQSTLHTRRPTPVTFASIRTAICVLHHRRLIHPRCSPDSSTRAGVRRHLSSPISLSRRRCSHPDISLHVGASADISIAVYAYLNLPLSLCIVHANELLLYKCLP